ncbi:Segregation and condensation protein B [Pseudoalteromonas luteoviolacea B = ATCC 29581]|nr:Segregation and condensation protein B [Pseudoalteromonas luteoviolacea B = ATCC 29581]
MPGRRVSDEQLQELIEAAIFVSEKPLTKQVLKDTVLADIAVSNERLTRALDDLQQHYLTRGIRLVEVGSGYRFQACSSLSPWLSKLWQERAPKFSRAMLETLALIAYRQPITRGEIEQVRGVAVSSQIMKSLIEREWIKVVGHKEVPGKPALYATTKQFLDYFSIEGLDALPKLPDRQLEKLTNLIQDPSVRELSE